jgi:hypothetical protein
VIVQVAARFGHAPLGALPSEELDPHAHKSRPKVMKIFTHARYTARLRGVHATSAPPLGVQTLLGQASGQGINIWAVGTASTADKMGFVSLMLE